MTWGLYLPIKELRRMQALIIILFLTRHFMILLPPLLLFTVLFTLHDPGIVKRVSLRITTQTYIHLRTLRCVTFLALPASRWSMWNRLQKRRLGSLEIIRSIWTGLSKFLRSHYYQPLLVLLLPKHQLKLVVIQGLITNLTISISHIQCFLPLSIF